MSDFIIKVNNKERTWSKEDVQSKLKQIGKLEGKQVAWIRSDLSLKKSSWFSRMMWTEVAKHFTTMRRAFYDVDLEQSRFIFDQLHLQIKNSEDQELIILFNNAVKKFNSIAVQHNTSTINPDVTSPPARALPLTALHGDLEGLNALEVEAAYLRARKEITSLSETVPKLPRLGAGNSVPIAYILSFWLGGARGVGAF
ncbi:MAG: hypothetical protein ACHQUC_09200 [Chlamydiales bacterium]